MCRNIKTLFNFEPPATDEEIRASAGHHRTAKRSRIRARKGDGRSGEALRQSMNAARNKRFQRSSKK